MMAMSKTLLTQTVPTLLVITAVCAFFYLLYKTKRKAFLRVLFKAPVVSDLVKKIDLTRFTRSMGLLLSSGIPITGALDLTRNVVMKKELVVAIDHCREFVISGKRISEALKIHKKVVPSIMIKIIEAGEKTGSLEKSMQEVSEFLDYEVSNALRAALTILEPMLMVVVGVMVGGMMLAIIAPIYGLIGQIAGK
jgi:type II secretory pathway component PulF